MNKKKYIKPKKRSQNFTTSFSSRKNLFLLVWATLESSNILEAYYTHIKQIRENIKLVVCGKERFLSRLKDIQSEKLILFISNNKEKEADLKDIVRSFQKNEGYISILPKNLSIDEFKTLTQSFIKNQNDFQNEVLIGIPENPSFSERISSLIVSVIFPMGINQIPLGINFFKIQKLQEICSTTFNFGKSDDLALFYQIKKTGLHLKHFQIKIHYSRSPFRVGMEILILFFQSFFEKFIQIPIHSIRNSKNLLAALNDGNNPIYRLFFFSLACFSLVWMIFLSFDFGITWDEWSNIDYANDVLNYYLSFGKDRRVFDMSIHARNSYIYYGPAFDLLCAILHKYIFSIGIYEVRHMLNAFCGALAVIMTGRIAKEMGNWRMAIIAMLLILLSPRFLGHSMNNPKDIPFALAYALSIYYMIRFFKQMPKPYIGTTLWLIFSIGLTISIKIGGLLIIAYFGFFGGLYCLFEIYNSGKKIAFRHLLRYIKYFLIIALISYILGILFWPYGLERPFVNPFIALKEFSNFRYLIIYELFEGERIYMRIPPAHYLLKWIAITIPIATLIGLLISIFSFYKQGKKYNRYIYLMLWFVLSFPIAYILIKESTLYNGWRHVIFIYIPFVVLSAMGWDGLLIYIQNSYLKSFFLLLYIMMIARPTIWIIKNHPNEYVYFNELVNGINGAYTNYETDYWCNSMRQATEWLIKNEPIKK